MSDVVHTRSDVAPTPPRRARGALLPSRERIGGTTPIAWEGVVIALICLLAGIAGAIASTAPTGRPVVDAALVGGGIAIVAAAGSRAPWWSVVLAAGAALLIAIDPVLIALAFAAAGLAWLAGAQGRDRPVMLAASLGVTLNVLARSEFTGFLGVSAVVGIAAACAVFVAGIRTCPRPVRRLAWGAGAIAVVVTGVAVAGAGYSVYSVRHHLSAGLRTAELGVAAMEQGDFLAGKAWFEQAAAELEQANDGLTTPWTAPAIVVPVLAQHRDAVVTLSDVGARGAAVVADAIDEMNLDELRIVDGRIDLDAIAALDEPLERVRAALVDLRAATADADSPWLINRARYEVDEFESSIGEHLPSIDTAIRALDLVPAMLGADEPRHYLLLFTNPAESSAIGGSLGSHAVLTVADGRFTLGAVGQTSDLDRDIAESWPSEETVDDELLERYGGFLFARDGTDDVGDVAFANVAMTPHFPWVGEAAAGLFEQATGQHIDGVIAVDPLVIETLLRFTGEITLPAHDVDLNSGNTFGFLVHNQYLIGSDTDGPRDDAVGDAATVTFDAIMTGALPDPIEFSNRIGWLVEQRRMLLWSARAEEQALLEWAGAAGPIPELDGSDGWAFTVANAAGNKIDPFLERRASYDAVTNNDGVTTATLTIELTNTAPTEGLPTEVIGNDQRLPAGTNRLFLSVYSALRLDDATLDGTPLGLAAGVERGWSVYSQFVDIPAGETVRLSFRLRGTVFNPHEVVTWEQPMAAPLDPIE